MNATSIGLRVGNLADQAKQTFIDREDVIDALACSICAGEHVIILGPPGTAKSALVRFFAEGMLLKFFRRVLNPDTNRWDLTGPLDPVALKDGRWENKWSGLATSDFALLDEIGKASGQVQDMLLDAMEERRVTSGDVDVEIPLHCAVACSNETLDDAVEAVWDRFTTRLVVGGLSNAADFVRMLSVASMQAAPQPITREEAKFLRDTALAMSRNVSNDVLGKMAEMWSERRDLFGSRISDRRWVKTLRLAAGRAILHGRTQIEVEDLIVGKWTLWGDLQELEGVAKWVEEKAFAHIAELRDAQALVQELRKQEQEIRTGNPTLEDVSRLHFRATKATTLVRGKDGPEWQTLRDILQGIIGELERTNV